MTIAENKIIARKFQKASPELFDKFLIIILELLQHGQSSDDLISELEKGDLHEVAEEEIGELIKLIESFWDKEKRSKYATNET